jgi:hypothetical protein
MQVKIDSVSDVKTNDRGTSSKMKCGNESYYVNEDATPHIGKAVEISVEEKTSQKGNKYKIAKIVKVLEGAAAVNSNSHVSWIDYSQMAKLAHNLALELEPDGSRIEPDGEPGSAVVTVVDRSQARIAFVQTVLVALRDGKLLLPGDDEIPF